MPFPVNSVRSMAFFCLMWLVPPSMLQAQTTPAKPQLVHIHEAPVLPTMPDQYERAAKDQVPQCPKHSIQNGWLMIQDNDHRYDTMEHMADLDKDPLTTLQEKMGKEAFVNLFAGFDKCYPSYCDYILVHLPEYSNEPDQTSQSEYAYRGFDYVCYEPQHQQKIKALFPRFKELYTSNVGKIPHNVHMSRFGTSENFLLVEDLAKSETVRHNGRL